MDTNVCSSLRSGHPSVRYPDCPCSCCHLQLQGDASLLEKDSLQIPTEVCLYFHHHFSLLRVQPTLPLLFAPSPLFLGTENQLFL